MIEIRYTAWDGSQKLKLDADKVFEKLAEYLSYTDDVRQAMDWMTRQGMDFDGSRVAGLEEFLEQLRQEMRQRYREFNLKEALSEVERRLQDIVESRARHTGADERREADARLTRSCASCSGSRAGSRRRFASSKAMSSRTPRRAPISRHCSRNTRTFATSKTSASATSICSTVPRASTTSRRSS